MKTSQSTSTVMCPCGQHAMGDEAHAIARRTTDDGIAVQLWSDGTVTTGLNTIVANGARTDVSLDEYIRAGRMVMDWVSIYQSSEVRGMVEAARWAAKRGLGQKAMFARMNREPTLKPVWTVLETDRDGKPRILVWKLPRLRWPGLAVWRERGSYSVWHESHPDTYMDTGLRFKNLRELSRHLLSIGVEHG